MLAHPQMILRALVLAKAQHAGAAETTSIETAAQVVPVDGRLGLHLK